MHIGILGGTGPRGRNPARRLASAGHDVDLGNRSPERAQQIAADSSTADLIATSRRCIAHAGISATDPR